MESIWRQKGFNLQMLNDLSAGTMAEWLKISFSEIGDNFLRAIMPVGPHVHQPMGLLHGGASAALAETIGSVASWLCIDQETSYAVGMEINCNHIRGKKTGDITATVFPLHIGASTHVWDIRIIDEREKLICVSRLTVAIRKK